MSAFDEPLSPRAARILYNVDDALRPDGALPVDVAPHVSRALRHQGVGAARRAWLVLHGLEWEPIVTLSSRRGFSWLPRERRRALLAGWERSALPARRRAFAWLAGMLAEARAGAGCSPERGSPIPSPRADG
jgi:hypothetical protein